MNKEKEEINKELIERLLVLKTSLKKDIENEENTIAKKLLKKILLLSKLSPITIGIDDEFKYCLIDIEKLLD